MAHWATSSQSLIDKARWKKHAPLRPGHRKNFLNLRVPGMGMASASSVKRSTSQRNSAPTPHSDGTLLRSMPL